MYKVRGQGQGQVWGSDPSASLIIAFIYFYIGELVSIFLHLWGMNFDEEQCLKNHMNMMNLEVFGWFVCHSTWT